VVAVVLWARRAALRVAAVLRGVGGWRLEARSWRVEGGGATGAIHAVARLKLMGLFTDFWGATVPVAQAAPIGDPPLEVILLVVTQTKPTERSS
jgi:hypothetical protein